MVKIVHNNVVLVILCNISWPMFVHKGLPLKNKMSEHFKKNLIYSNWSCESSGFDAPVSARVIVLGEPEEATSEACCSSLAISRSCRQTAPDH